MAWESKRWLEINPDDPDRLTDGQRERLAALGEGAVALGIPVGSVLLIREGEHGIAWFEIAPPIPDCRHVWDQRDVPLP
jgi:hypothetical protein